MVPSAAGDDAEMLYVRRSAQPDRLGLLGRVSDYALAGGAATAKAFPTHAAIVSASHTGSS
jgi:hypothetical protein